MIRSSSGTIGARIRTTDGIAGRVADLYIDDVRWIVREIIIATKGWRAERLVALSPAAVAHIEPDYSSVVVAMSNLQVLDLCDVVKDESLPRHGAGARSRFAWLRPRKAHPELPASAIHLHSVNEIASCRLEAPGGFAGHVVDVLYDSSWKVRTFVARTRRLWRSRTVLLPVDCIVDLGMRGIVVIDLSARQLESLPSFYP